MNTYFMKQSIQSAYITFSHSYHFTFNVPVCVCSSSKQIQYETGNGPTQNEDKNPTSNDNISNEFIQEENGLHVKYKRFVQATDNRTDNSNNTTTTNGKCPVTGAQFEQGTECPVAKSTHTINEKKEKGYIHKVYEEQ